MSDISITFETLFEMLRRERSREELQELSATFYADVSAYFQSKQALADDKKAQVQLENAKKLLRELYEKRERKILQMALSKSRTGSDITDPERLLSEEKELFDEIRAICDKSRSKVLKKALKAEIVVEKKEKPVNTMVRFVSPVPKFVGKQLEAYGPFDAEDVVSLPTEIAEVLVNKGRAKYMEE